MALWTLIGFCFPHVDLGVQLKVRLRMKNLCEKLKITDHFFTDDSLTVYYLISEGQ